jgi:hypothetical protein
LLLRDSRIVNVLAWHNDKSVSEGAKAVSDGINDGMLVVAPQHWEPKYKGIALTPAQQNNLLASLSDARRNGNYDQAAARVTSVFGDAMPDYGDNAECSALWKEHILGRFRDRIERSGTTAAEALPAANLLWDVARQKSASGVEPRWFQQREFEKLIAPLRAFARRQAADHREPKITVQDVRDASQAMDWTSRRLEAFLQYLRELAVHGLGRHAQFLPDIPREELAQFCLPVSVTEHSKWKSGEPQKPHSGDPYGTSTEDEQQPKTRSLRQVLGLQNPTLRFRIPPT